MKQLLILLISIIFCSCSTYKIALTSYADNRFILHETTRPDTCKQSRLTYVSFRKKKNADTTYKMNVSYTYKKMKL